MLGRFAICCVLQRSVVEHVGSRLYVQVYVRYYEIGEIRLKGLCACVECELLKWAIVCVCVCVTVSGCN